MKLLSCSIENFISYKKLLFNFNNLGLTLITGSTGSGKSTLEDIPTWILYGVTSKNVSVDDVKTWNCESATRGVLEVDTPSGVITVTRVRGKSTENDLYWTESTGEKIRGKDITDTQKRLNLRLGVDPEVYCASACFNEFSDTSNFFTLKAKERRQLFDKIANLSFPSKLAEKSSLKKSEYKQKLVEKNQLYAREQGKLDQLKDSEVSVENSFNEWALKQDKYIKNLEQKSKSFDKEKRSKIDALEAKSFRFEADRKSKIEIFVDKLDEIDQKIIPNSEIDYKIEKIRKELLVYGGTCPTCKRPHKEPQELIDLEKKKIDNNRLIDNFSEYSDKLRELRDLKNPYNELIEQAEQTENYYSYQIESETKKQNPFKKQIHDTKQEIQAKQKIVSDILKEIETINKLTVSYTQLYDLSAHMRSVLLQRAVKQVESQTNSYLETYFDSEISVSLNSTSSDSIDAVIQKNGNSCSFYQLSKGQRQLLKLCFSLSIMEAASNKQGVQFSSIFLDEALDGLDTSLKLKAYNLFEDLSTKHESVLVIDHSEELKTLFTNKINVVLYQDESVLEFQNE